mmetsp:Transcript_120010/g.344987  ORF Transcript_120010/g.344987 Transcript_120010/m.344987 type:complete len:169 (-) Transcript_120010:2130-2636(-)
MPRDNNSSLARMKSAVSLKPVLGEVNGGCRIDQVLKSSTAAAGGRAKAGNRGDNHCSGSEVAEAGGNNGAESNCRIASALSAKMAERFHNGNSGAGVCWAVLGGAGTNSGDLLRFRGRIAGLRSSGTIVDEVVAAKLSFNQAGGRRARRGRFGSGAGTATVLRVLADG